MQKWSVTLTGELKPGTDAATAWQRAAEVLGKDANTFEAQVLNRLPMTTRSSDEDAAMTRWQALDACGVKALLLPDDGQGLKVRLDGMVRGPVSFEYARRQLASRAWDGQIEACPDNQDDWVPLRSVLQQGSGNDAGFNAAPSASAAHAGGGASRPRTLRELPTAAEYPNLHAGFWRRVAAYLLDMLIFAVPLVILEMLLFHVNLHARHGKLDLLNGVLVWLYFAAFESSSWQGTPGKHVLGLIVVDGKGLRIGIVRALLRYLGKYLSWIILCIGFMMAGWTARKQALHDLLVGTCVVQRPDMEALNSAEE